MTGELVTDDTGTVIFQERYAMGESLKSLWTKSISTWKCLSVKLTGRRLVTGLHGLQGALVRMFGADLEHDIPVSDILSVVRGKDFFGRGEVKVNFRLPEGGDRTLILYLQKADEFAALASIAAGL